MFEDVTRFGRELTWSKVVRSAVNMLDRLVVGLITTPTGLGFYTAARRWSNLPVQEVHLATLHPSVAWLVRSGSNDMDFRSSVRMSTVFPMILAIPACAWLFLEAPTVVETVFGNAWLGVVPLFRVLLVAAVCRLPVMLMSQVYYSEGRSREQLRWTWFEAAVFSAAILLGALGDERTVAFAYAGISVALAPIGVYYAAQGSRAKFSDLIVPWCVIMTYSSVAFGCSAFGRDRLSGFGSDVIMALISAAIFLVAFFLLMLVTWSFSGLRKTVLGRHPLRVIWRENVSPPGGSESGGAVIQGDRTRN